MKGICAFLGALLSVILFLIGFCYYILTSFKCPPGFVLLSDGKRCMNESLYYEYSTSEAIPFHPERERGRFLLILAAIIFTLCMYIIRVEIRKVLHESDTMTRDRTSSRHMPGQGTRSKDLPL